MANYYVNNQPQWNGDHEVHRDGCSYMPTDWRFLGDHPGCAPAVAVARVHHPQSNGCVHCSAACHTS